MDRIKRPGFLLPAAVLAAVLLAVLALIGGVFAADTENTAGGEPVSYIYFDLAAGNVDITDTTYTGWIFVGGTATEITGAHAKTNKYYVFQSNLADKADTGYETETDMKDPTKCRIPQYDRVKTTVDGVEKSWTEHITNNANVKAVSEAWENAATNVGRTALGEQAKNNAAATGNRITFANKSNYEADVTIDNIWTYYQIYGNSRSTGGITAHLEDSTDTKIYIRLKGDNRFGNIHYGANENSRNQIIFSNGEPETQTPGSITVADFPQDLGKNHWASAIGGDDAVCDRSDGIVIESGVIYAGTTAADNCTALGGGGNEYGRVTINNGTVTAVAATTGTAIGGGIGWGGGGGNADVTINKGEVYAYNFGVDNSSSDKFEHYVPAVAIGGGSSQNSDGNNRTTVNINGGFVYAQCMGGAAIGGGGSAKKAGGKATININGGTIIAKSTSGKFKGTADPDVVEISAGVSIGGGTGLTAGGAVTLNIKGENTILRTGSIGGGSATGKDEAGNPYKAGNAAVTVEGGDIIGQVIMAGGAAHPCSFTMTGGVIHSTNVIDGVTIGNENITGVTVTDPNPSVPLSFIRKDGGAVFMNDAKGVAVITGGTIGNCTANNGGAIYMAGGSFTLSGTGQLGTNHAKESGGSVFVGGGTVQIGGGVELKDEKGAIITSVEDAPDAWKCAIRTSDAAKNGGGVYVVGTPGQEGATVIVKGGEIHSNTAGENGGGMYIDQGKVDLFGGSIHDNRATKDGGGVYVAGDVHMLNGSVTENKAVNGGGFCVIDGTVLMYGGSIDHNTAVENGGAMHISSTTDKEPVVDIFSGTVSYNEAKLGGGVSVISLNNNPIHVTVGVNCVHPKLDTKSRAYTPFDYPDIDTNNPGTIPTTPKSCGDAHEGHTHYHIGEVKQHSSCPSVVRNVAKESGGGFYLKSAKSSLVFYCILEEGNTAQENSQCYNMDVEGGQVEIGDKTYDYTKNDPVKGNLVMQSSILVTGGTVDIYGTMVNPNFTEEVTVDIKQNTDHYVDHRFTKHDDTHALYFYKVHYYENFKGDGDTPTGLYKTRQYPDKDHVDLDVDVHERYDFTIMPSVFSRPGYKIVGWNKDPEGNGQEYKVNETYNFKDLERADASLPQEKRQLGANIKHNNSLIWDDSLLVIYAIWERCGYVLKFDPNVGEGETYTGTMENQTVTVGVLNGTQTIHLNQFKRPGYKFVGWTLVSKPTATDTVYADGHAITTDFTGEDGATVTLYAKWERCTHVDSLVYTANGNVLTQSCSACGGHTATATVSAVNTVYDGNTHLAAVNFSVNWLGDKPEISYEMAANSEWDDKDSVNENWLSNPQPLHAGNYTAKLTTGGATAQAKYVISRVKWETPAVPQISFKVEKVGETYNSVITVTTPTGRNVMYKITHLPNDGTETDVEGYLNWQSANEFANIPYGKYYYFYAKACEDRDHIESDLSKSAAYLTTGGNIVYIEHGEGIKVVPHYGTGSFQYTVSAADGYHLRGYKDNLESDSMSIGPTTLPNFVKPIPGVESGDAYIYEDGITIHKTGPTDGTYTYTLTLVDGKVAYHQITLQFSGAAKNASVAHKVTDGEVFSDFNGKDTSISRDSAFTAQFTVRDYIPAEYTKQALNFSQVLPAGTTIILKADNNYWYYKVGEVNREIDLTYFTAMGGTDRFKFDTEGTSAQSFTYQFIVDFSKTAGISVGSLDVSLVLTTLDTSIPAQESTHVSVGLKEKATFVISSTDVVGKSATLNCTYTPSKGAASIWNGRKAALVFTAPVTAPADLTLTAVIAGNTTRYTMNAERQFIIPLGKLDTKEIKITLHSNLFGSSVSDLAFTADWYVSKSGSDKSPLKGDAAAHCNVSFSCQKDPVPSVRIDGSDHLLHAGGKLKVTVNYAGIPDKGTVTAYLQRKMGESYIDTGAKEPVISDTTDLTNAGTNKQVEFSMGQMDKGSYRILVIVRESGANILQVPYYFVIA